MKSIKVGLIVLAGAFLAAPSPGQAQQLIAEYYTLLTGADLRNSSGAALGSFCAIVQQDRANHHRFGIRHDGDQWDPIFADPAARAQISANCQLAAGSEYLPSAIAQYGTRYVWVRVYGSGTWPTMVLVSEGAG
ncbi:hypothetical protein [uncultured Tateyamaria sp.]|uniref:hypothetical protein n=1 Tax=uncultured Tateyamaria sp. TaxID=455651 RepID=UPI002627FDCB|nr:hypothetical protein [uncultured Tateyamaria sp.]